MSDLSGIARHLRLSVDQIRLAADLIEQGYSPTFIERYRGDETGALPGPVLWRLKFELDRRKRLEAAKVRALGQLPKDSVLDPEAERALVEANSSVAIDAALRCFRARRTLDQSQEKDTAAGQLLESMLTYSGAPVDDLVAWAAEQLAGQDVDAAQVLAQAKRLVGSLVQCDSTVATKLRQYIQRQATLRVEEIATPASEAAADVEGSDAASDNEAASPTLEHAIQETDQETESTDSMVPTDDASVDTPEHDLAVAYADDEHVERQLDSTSDIAETAGEESAGENATEVDVSTVTDVVPTSFSKTPKGKKGNSKKQTVSLKSFEKLTPRQRRRRWLTSVLAPMRNIKKPLSRLTSYQLLMLGRGARSQLISILLDYDQNGLVDISRNSFTDAKHPFANWFGEAVANALDHGLRSKVEADSLAELEERAGENLLEHATEDLKRQLMRRPVRGQTIALIDTVGPKSVVVAFIDPVGRVLACEELPCSAQPDVVNQNVVKLGEWIHRHQVNLISVTNGPSRRFMVVTLREIMKQSQGSGLRWTMADRSGAEAYAAGRIGLKELSLYNRRQRAAIWAARCLQDPLVELLKVDLNRLRLGSYQRELPQDSLKHLVQEAIADCVCARGIDAQNASEHELQYIPGVGPEQSRQIFQLAQSGSLMSRSQLVADVQNWSEADRRHAIGWLRVFGSENALDATLIHPEDYYLAQRLIDGTELSLPPATPPGWVKRTLAVEAAPVAEATAAPVAEESQSDGSDSANADTIEAIEVSEGVESVEGMESTIDNADVASIDADVVDDVAGAEDAPSEVTASEGSESEPIDPPSEAAEPHVTADAEQVQETSEQSDIPAALPFDADKLANQWQVGRVKLTSIAKALFDPFGDSRLSGVPVPVHTELPTLENLTPGTCVWAVIVGVADFGVFVELGPNCNGLIHISRLSPHFIEDPHQCVQVGDLVMTWVVDIEQKKNRVALTALSPAQREQMKLDDEARKAQAAEERQHRGGDRGRRGGGHADRGHGERGAPQGAKHGTSTRSDGGALGQGRGGHGRGQRQHGKANASEGQPGNTSGSRSTGDRYASRAGHGGRSGGRDGGGRPGRGRSRDSQPREGKSIVVTSKQPKTPISQAMKQGDEPLRSFSDLVQFYEAKRTEPDEQKAPETSAPADTLQTSVTAEASENAEE